MSENKNEEYEKPYEQGYYPPVPTGFTKFLRFFLPWQIYRFIAINVKMVIIIFRSHG